MTARLTPGRILAWTGLVGAISGAVTVLAAAMLTASFRPAPPGGATGPSEGWVVLHATAASILGMAAFAALLVLVWPTGGPTPWRHPVPIAAAAVATVAAAAAIATRDMVAFDQIALRSVRVGDDISGYWFAAFDPDVELLLVEGRQVGQATYARTLVVHLVAPVLAVVGLVAAVWTARRQRGGSST